MRIPEAIAAEFASMIEGGSFRPGERLPSARALAKARGTSLASVMAAYESLADRGLVEIRPRSGYYVAARVRSPRASAKPDKVANAAEPVAVSELAFQVLAQIREKQVVPLGSAFPSPALFPLARLAQDLSRATRRMDPWRTVEDMSPGSAELRRQIARRYAAHGLAVDADEIVITSGAMEALNLCLAAATRPGDVVALECPAFYAALQAAERLGLRVVQVRTDVREGVDLAALEQAIERHGVKACWLMPTLQNPLGATMPEAKRARLVQVLSRLGVTLIEDDAYAELRSDGPLRPAKAFDTQGIVMHCGSFSKSLAPGYRVGWCVPGRLRQQVERAKLTTSIATSVPAQEGIAEFLRQGGYERHLRRLRRSFDANRARMRETVLRAFPGGTTVTEPDGGYFVWVEMPTTCDAMKLHARAVRKGLSIAPGPMFSTGPGFGHALRLNCGHPWDAAMEAAISRLARLAN